MNMEEGLWLKLKNTIIRMKDLSHLGIANIIGKIIAAVFWFFLAALLGAEAYGEVSYLIATATIVAGLSLLGGTETITVYSAKKIPIQPPIFLITAIIGAIGSLVIYFILDNIVISFFVMGYVIFNLITASLLGRKLYKKYAIYFIVQKIVFAITATLLYFLIDINGIILGYAISFLVFSGHIINEFKNTKLDFSLLKPRIKFMAHSYGLTIEKLISGQTDKIIIAPMLGFAALGNYHLTFQVLSLLTMLPAIVFQYVLPQDASGISHPKLKQLTIIISIFLTVIAIIITPIGIPILFPEYVEAIQLIQIMSISAISNAINVIYSAKFYGKEKSNIVFFGQACLIVVYITGIFVLGNYYGINGVAIAYVLGSITQSIFFVIMSRKFTVDKQN
jgi:O-antigen/teichoic acid export membrane protein